jgi:hypothetical protein
MKFIERIKEEAMILRRLLQGRRIVGLPPDLSAWQSCKAAGSPGSGGSNGNRRAWHALSSQSHGWIA